MPVALAFIVWMQAWMAQAAAPVISVPPAGWSAIEGSSHNFQVTAGGSAPLAYEWRKDGSPVADATNAVLALTSISTSAAGYYSVVVTNAEGAITSALARLTVRLTNDPAYPAPNLGWTYLYGGVGVASGLTNALDGSWDHQNDSWLGDGRGTNNGLVGGLSSSNGVLTIEDGVTGTTGGTFNNRRFNFLRNVALDASVTNADTLLNDGVTLTFRARLTPPGDPWIELTNAPNGLVNNADGKGMFSIRQAGGGGMLIGFSLNQAVEDTSTSATFNFGQAGLHMNHLNGNFRTNNVDPGESGTLNLLPLDPAAFHEFWITIADNASDPGTHRVSIYLDGALAPSVFNVTAGTGSETTFTNYLALGMNSATQRGAVDVDFFGYKPGVVLPSAFNQPVGIVTQPASQFVALGQAANFHVGLTGTPPFAIQWYRNGNAIPGATNQSYQLSPVTAGDDAAQFHVLVANDLNTVTSAPVAEIHLLGAPLITTQPQSLTVTNGDPATLTVTAASPVPPLYQWRRNGTPLPAATNATLNFNPAGPADAGTYDVLVANDSGSVTSALATLTVVLFDHGDAPDPGYPTLRASNGARHRIVPGVYLGTLIDAEADGHPGAAANGDDTDGPDDEDGVNFPAAWPAGQTILVEIVASTNGYLNAWVDWNQDAAWTAPGEQIFTNAPLVPGTNTLALPVPGPALAGPTFARFRFDTTGGLTPTGPAADGEVEDYAVTISPRADLRLTQTLSANPVAVQSNLTLTVHLTNAGPSTATGVLLTNQLPPGVNLLGVNPTQGTCYQAGDELICDLGALPAHSPAQVTLTLRPQTAGLLTFNTTVRSPVEDPQPADNTAAATVTALDPPAIGGNGAITGQPANLTVTNGGTAILTVTATGSAPLAFQWYRAGNPLPGRTNATLLLAPVTTADAGPYTVRLTNLVGTVESGAATLTVLLPPVITAQPASATHLAGSVARLNVTASGTAPLTYYWRYNGASLAADPEQAGLMLNPVLATNAGGYTVTVSNAAGVVTSLLATLTVVEMDFGDAPAPYPSSLAANGARHRLAPGIWLGTGVDFEPEAVTDALATGDDLTTGDDEDGVSFATTLRTGQGVNVLVVASTNGFLNGWVDFNRDQSWAQAGEQVFTNRALVPGTNNLSFAVPTGASLGQSFARFRFSSVQGLSFTGEAANGEVEDYEVAIEAVAELSILNLSQINPIAVGSNQVYSIVVSNAGPSVATGVSLSDALPAGLSFVSAPASQGSCVHSAGTVACALGSLNPGGVATVNITALVGVEGALVNSAVVGANQVDVNPTNNSATATANALFFPVILAQPETTAVTNGGTATFAVNATGTGVQYQWRLNGTNLPGASAASLILTNAQVSNEGAYSVRITNAVGSVTSVVVTLSILQPVIITAQPQSQAILLGSNVSFSVTATGTAPLSYQWSFNGADLPGQTGPALTLTGVQTNQAGAYHVRVANLLGTVASSDALLTVLVPPFFTLQPQGATNPTAFPLTTFQTAVEGTAPVRVQWYFNRTNLLALQTNLTFSLTNLQTSNAGSYSVVASNVAGVSTSAVAVLAVFDMDFGDAPSAQGYPTMLAANGARHRVVTGIRLGAGIDAETNGLPNATATGDDTRVLDDEDGVLLPAGVPAGVSTPISVIASTNGFLDAWIDFNGNGSWADAGDQVFTGRALIPGTNSLLLNIPSTAVAGTRFARFRFSTAGGLAPDGLANDGEVEDYQITIVPTIDLVLGMIESQDPVPVSSNVTYTISVTNRGPSTAALVWVTNPIPAAVTFVSAATSGGQGFCGSGSGVVYCLLDDMAKDVGATVSVTLRASITGTYTNRAWVSALGAGTEAVPADNTNFLTTTFIGAPASFANPASVSVADATASAPGKGTPYPSTITVAGLTSAVYKVTVTLSNLVHDFAKDFDILLVGPRGQNVLLMSDAGASALAGVTLSFDDSAADPLPSSGALAAGTYRPSNYGPGIDVFPAPAPVGPFGNALSVFNGTDPNGVWSLYVVDGVIGGLGSMQGGWRLEITATDPIADLAVTASASSASVALGSNLVYAVAATNRGPAVASQVRLTNTLPAGVSFVSASSSSGSCAHAAGIVSCDFGVLASGAGALVNITVLPVSAGSLTNLVRLSAAQLDPVFSNNLAQVSVLARAATDLLVAQGASTNLALVGRPLSFLVVVTNRGPNADGAVRVRSDFPAPSSAFVSAVASQGSCAHTSGVVTCELGALAGGGRAQVVVSVVPTLVGGLTNSVSVAGETIDSNATNNVAVLGLAAVLEADLQVEMGVGSWEMGGGVVAAGEVLTHFLTVSNRGPNAALNVVLGHALPAGVAFVGGSASIGACAVAGGEVRCAIPVIDAFSAVEVALQVVPSLAATLTNVFVVGGDSADFVPSNNVVSSVVQVLLPPVITGQPQGGVFTNGAGVVLSVAASGSGPLGYQWSRLDLAGAWVEVAGANGAVLSLPNIEYAARGGYRVRVTNAVGAVTSAVASVTVRVRPTISDVADVSINEDAQTGVLAVSVGDEDGGANGLTLVASSSNGTLVPPGGLVVSGSGGARSLRVSPATNQAGVATITLRVTDGDGLSAVDTFVLTVNEVNDAPSVSDLGDVSFAEDTAVVVAFDVGDVETAVAALSVTVSSDNAAVVSTNGLSVSGTGAQRSLRIVPVTNAFGSAVVTVRVQDGGGLSVSDSFVVTVVPVNDAPRLAPVADVVVAEDSGARQVALTGIDAGASNELQGLSISAASGNTAVITNVGVSYASPSNVAVLSFETFPNASGQALITVTLRDDGASNNVATQTFTVTVLPVNDVPQLVGLAEVNVLEDGGEVSVAFQVQDVETAAGALQVFARSLSPALVPDAALALSGAGASRAVRFQPATNLFGEVTLEVAVVDSEGGAVTNQVLIRIAPVNDLPTLSPVANVAMDQDTTSAPIGIVVGDVETAAASLNVSATSSAPGLFPAGSFVFGGTGTQRSLVLVPAPGQHGTATVTIQVTDLEGGAGERSFQVTVREVIPPAILIAPVGRTVTNGAAVSFSVTTAGTLPISYQWTLNGVVLPGATNATLSLPVVGPANAGAYRVSAGNAGGSATSDPAMLRVLVAPRVESITRSGAGVDLAFPTLENLSYTVEFTGAAEPLLWTPLVSVPGTGGTLTVNDPAGGLPARLYRVRVE